MYHRVAALENDNYGLAVHPRLFAEHVEYLRRLGCVVPLVELVSPGTSNKVAITFDDGYADNATVAAPLLTQADLPATFFITTGCLGAKRFWWDRLASAFLGPHALPPGIDVSVSGQGLWLALNDAEARMTSLRFLHRRLRPVPPEELLATVDELLTRLAVPTASDDSLTMTSDQLLGLANRPLVEIGAHTRTHLQLAGQTEELQQREVDGSISDLEQLLKRPVVSFAFPFGTQRAVGDIAPRLVRTAGCYGACSTEPGVVTGRSDPYRLPRINVRNWTADEMAERVRRTFAGV